jgi:hypothetical protein
MAVDFTNELYVYAQNVFSRPITVTPIASQPGQPAYDARGILDSKETDVLAEDGSVYSDSKTILDIRMQEFVVLPMQRDRIDIPPIASEPGGSFEVMDLAGIGNAGGEITLTLKRITTAKPATP